MSLLGKLKKSVGLSRHPDGPDRGHESPQQNVDVDVDVEASGRRIETLRSQFEAASDDDERIRLLNEIGALQQALGAPEAVETFESSMAIREQYGPAYNALLTLYNDRLRAAAQAKDDAAIHRWTAKLDELVALSKRVMRSNY